jgi:carbonic anhydrase/acetyltransferase-like protein (isoleucine patch superfamily)
MNIRNYGNLRPKIDENAYIDPTAVVVGDVTIGEYSSLWPTAVVRGDIHYVSIGKYTNIQDGSVIHVTPETHPVNIGDYVTVGHRVVLHGCTIKDGALIGMGAILLDGSLVEENALVAAGALVPEGKRIPAGYLALGTPAKPIRKLTEEQIKMVRENTEHYVEIAMKYKEEIAKIKG